MFVGLDVARGTIFYWSAPPLRASPLRENLRVERTGLVTAFRLVLRTDGKNFSGVGGAQKDFSFGVTHDAGDLRGAGLGQLRVSAALIDGQQRSIVPRARQQAAVLRHA